MNEQEAVKIAKQIIGICKENKPDVWHKALFDNQPDLTLIKIDITIKIVPSYTRKMELKQ